MNGFLVMFGGLMDDIPLRFFSNREDAEAYAEGITGLYDPRVQEAIGLTGRDISTASMLSVTEFVGGIPVAYQVLPKKIGDDLAHPLDTPAEHAGMSNDA